MWSLITLSVIPGLTALFAGRTRNPALVQPVMWRHDVKMDSGFHCR